MCTLVVLFRPGQDWPLIVAANRDESLTRSWQAPARHWPDRPHVIAGLDDEAGGSWLGLNDHGVVAAVLNRVGSLGAEPGKRSRGELVLEALDHAEAESAVAALRDLNPYAYRSFNLFIADSERAYWLRHAADPDHPSAIEPKTLPAGLSMITAHDRNDMQSPRIRDYLGRFAQVAEPDPESGDWEAWTALMASRAYNPDAGPRGAMTMETEEGFGTSSSALIALPALGGGEEEAEEQESRKPRFLFAPGPPDRTPYETVPGIRNIVL